MTSKTEARIETEKFSKRKKTLFSKARALAEVCNVQLYLVVIRNGRYYTYKSTGVEPLPAKQQNKALKAADGVSSDSGVMRNGMVSDVVPIPKPTKEDCACIRAYLAPPILQRTPVEAVSHALGVLEYPPEAETTGWLVDPASQLV